MKLYELMDIKDMKKDVDSKEMRKRVINANGNPFGKSKKKKVKEALDLDDMKKKVDPKEMRKRVIKAHGNPFGKTNKKK